MQSPSRAYYLGLIPLSVEIDKASMAIRLSEEIKNFVFRMDEPKSFLVRICRRPLNRQPLKLNDTAKNCLFLRVLDYKFRINKF